MMAYAKAVVGGAIAFLSSLATALSDNNISGQEWVTAAIAGLLGLGIVYGVPNIKNGANK